MNKMKKLEKGTELSKLKEYLKKCKIEAKENRSGNSKEIAYSKGILKVVSKIERIINSI